MTTTKPCPCDPGRLFSECCKPILFGNIDADTAEALMRSRYTAYVLRDADYLLKSWHSSTRPATIDPSTIPEWRGLNIVKTDAGKKDDITGIVEFKAVSLAENRVGTLHEVSSFVKETGQWFYIDGDIQTQDKSVTPLQKVGRNELCPCGSGKKFKKCCSQ